MMKDIIINDRYRVDQKIGAGGFGLVYAGTDMESNEKIAIKLMLVKNGPEMLESESETYAALSGGAGIPRVFWSGEECDYYVLVCDLLGPSLEDLFNYCRRRFSLKTILLIAEQAITRIKYIHSRGFLHRDIKPENFLMGSGSQGNVLYTIDFGLAKEFCEAKQDRNAGGRSVGGTIRYASLNNHNRLEQSWGDDLESLGYVLIYLARGLLPWQELEVASDEDNRELIKDKKSTVPVHLLCEGLPGEFVRYIEYTRALGFEDKPNYTYLQQLFRRLFASKGFKHDNVYDWTEKLFHETQGQVE
ncbi:hypothetical protein G7046_g9834 [Stylonectria norvegica]|nr:hypothetical protein G7046_g9834 [Stylonectria norvegica]